MNKENQAIINKAVKGLVDRLEKTETFVLEQAPGICKEMIKEEYIKNISTLIGVVLLNMGCFATAFFCYYKGHRSLDLCSKAYFDNCSFSDWYAGTIGALLLGAVFVACTVEPLQNLFLLKNCPKLFLLRRFKSLLRSR